MARPSLFSDDELLGVARATFLELGPGVSTTVIAERAGVSQATLFKRFGSKDEILSRALLPPEHPPFLALLEAGPDGRPFAAQLHELLTAIDAFFRSMIPAMMMLQSLGRDHFTAMAQYDVSPPVRAHRAITAWLDRAVEAGLIRPLDTRVLAVTLMGSLHTRRFLIKFAGVGELDSDSEPFIDALIDNLQAGFAPEERE